MSIAVIADRNFQITGLRREPHHVYDHVLSINIIGVRYDFMFCDLPSVAPCYTHGGHQAHNSPPTLQPPQQQQRTELPRVSLTMTEPDATLAAPLFSFNKSDIVTLLAGPDEHELIVYESCITRNSDFFRAAMKKEWTEGQTRTIKLPEESCIETLTHYLNYAYS